MRIGSTRQPFWLFSKTHPLNTENTAQEKLRYPTGKFQAPKVYNEELLDKAIKTVKDFPKNLKAEVEHLSKEQLEIILLNWKKGKIRFVLGAIPAFRSNLFEDFLCNSG